MNIRHPLPVIIGALGLSLTAALGLRHLLPESASTAASSGSVQIGEPLQTQGFFFDTVITITLYDTEDSSLLEKCSDLMTYYENTLSRTKEGSDVWNINHSAGKPVEVSDDTLELLTTSLNYCDMSGGALDIALAPVIDLWDFHSENKPSVPDAASIEEAIHHVDYSGIRIEGNSVTMTDPDGGIDLGSIAKGYISDKLRDLILENGCTSAMINLGGNVLTIGTKPDGNNWKVGIRRPFGESSSDLQAVVSVKDMSVITSGTYERYFEQDGILYHHILDPETGYPTRNGLNAVTILSPNGTDGDALSTSCFVLGLEKGLKLINSLEGIEAMFIDEQGDVHFSDGWPMEQTELR